MRRCLFLTTTLFFSILGNSLEAAPVPDSIEVKKFFNQVIPSIIKSSGTAGLVVSVVRNGKISYEQGFGYSDVSKKTPVNPRETLFRPGSISKLFVWTAVMQLVEAGKLDLDTDINEYLDFKIPATYPEVITLNHLMSHTPGFEDSILGLFTKDKSKILSIKKVASIRTIRRILPPGQEISYSNYGTVLAGYIVQRISGLPFEEYIEKRIFAPLKMKHSTFRQPLPPGFASKMSKGYLYDGKHKQEKVFEIIQGTPAGGLTSSARDIALFMQAHLDPAAGGLMKAETKKFMHGNLYRTTAGTNGMAHGFVEFDVNNQRVIGHAGDTIYFHSILFLIPEQNLGVYISMNTGTMGGLITAVTLKLYHKFMNHFYPMETGKTLAKNFTGPPLDLSGQYTVNRRSESDMTKILSLSTSLNVTPNERGGWNILDITSGKEERFVQVAPGILQKADGSVRIAYIPPQKNRPAGLFFQQMPVMLFYKTPWQESLSMVLLSLGIAPVLLLLALIFRPMGVLAIFSKKHKQTGIPRLAGVLAFATAFVYIFFQIVLSLTMGVEELLYGGIPPAWPFLIPWVGFLFGLSLPFFAVKAWRDKYWALPGRIFYSIFAVQMQLYFIALFYWRIAY